MRGGTTSPIQAFAQAATTFCDWCRSKPGDERSEARLALRNLSRLYLLAQELRELEDAPDIDADRPNSAAWHMIFKRFGTMPFSYYQSIFDPHNINEAAATGDLADDLADIYRDLSEGVALYDAGHVDSAEWAWAFSFRKHWGRHAASAIHALHCWFADEGAW